MSTERAPSLPAAARAGTLVVSGGRPLKGEIAPAGAKNAALALIVAAALGERPSTLRNVPLELNDVQILLRCLDLGGRAREASSARTRSSSARARASARQARGPGRRAHPPRCHALGRAAALGQDLALPQSGGAPSATGGTTCTSWPCAPSAPTVDESETGLLHEGRLRGADISFRLPTTGGTENALLAAVLGRATRSCATPTPARRSGRWPSCSTGWARRSPSAAASRA
jgi:UDP-N-acetylglucosamine 1-carboxyvinyltransferase